MPIPIILTDSARKKLAGGGGAATPAGPANPLEPGVIRIPGLSVNLPVAPGRRPLAVQPNEQPVLVYISGHTIAAAGGSPAQTLGGGVYATRAVTPPDSLVVTSNFSTTTIGTTATADDSYGINLREIGESTHLLTHASNTTQKYFLAIDWTTAADGKPVRILIGPAWWAKACT